MLWCYNFGFVRNSPQVACRWRRRSRTRNATRRGAIWGVTEGPTKSSHHHTITPDFEKCLHRPHSARVPGSVRQTERSRNSGVNVTWPVPASPATACTPARPTCFSCRLRPALLITLVHGLADCRDTHCDRLDAVFVVMLAHRIWRHIHTQAGHGHCGLRWQCKLRPRAAVRARSHGS